QTSTLFPYTTLFRSVRKNVLLLLRDKGILSNEDLSALNVSAVNAATTAPAPMEATLTQAAAPKPAAPAFIAAVAPVRVLPIDPRSEEHTSELQSRGH